jgi:hypothetical protein
MKERSKKNIELNIAIGIAAVLLLSVIFTFVGKKDRQKPDTKETNVSIIKEKTLDAAKLDFAEPEFEAMTREVTKKELEYIKEKKDEKEPEVILLKDLPLDSLSEDPVPLQETAEPLFKTQPTIENVKKLKEKGLIIY